MFLKFNKYQNFHFLIQVFTLWKLTYVRGSDSDLKKFKIFKSWTQEDYEQLQNYDFKPYHEQLCQGFRNLLKVENIDNTTVDNCCQHLKGKRIVFNKGNNWNVSDEDLIMDNKNNEHSDVYTRFIFYFNEETCTLNLNEKETKDFLIGKFFINDFVIPKDAELEFNENNIQQYKVKYTIQSGYNAVYEQDPGYKQNIFHIIELLRGLHLISYENRVKISDGIFYMKEYKNIWNFEFPSIIRNLLLFRAEYTTGKSRSCFLEASQFLAGKIYYYNLNEKIKEGKIVLSSNLNKIFSFFDDTIQKMVSEILRGNFLNVEIEKKDMKRNVKKLKQIYHFTLKLLEAQKEFSITRQNYDRVNYYLRILRKQ